MGVLRIFWQGFIPIMRSDGWADGGPSLRWDDGGFFRHTGAGLYLGGLAVCCKYFLGDFSLRSK